MSLDHLNHLLENFNEVPTERCWNSIEQQLNIILPTGTNATVNGSNMASSKTVSLMSKIATAPIKVAAISGSVIIVATVAIVAIHSLLSPTIVLNGSSNNSFITVVDSAVVNTNTELQSDSSSTKVIKQSFDQTVQKENHTSVSELTHLSAKAPLITQSVSNSSTILPNVEERKLTVQNVNTNEAVSVVSTPTPKDPLIDDQDVALSIPIKITIPNVFTPNGDGYNDFFVIEGIEDCNDPKLYIKSTNGKLLFQSSSYRNDWQGDNCPDGVYLYYFTYKVNNIEEKMSGRVIIKR